MSFQMWGRMGSDGMDVGQDRKRFSGPDAKYATDVRHNYRIVRTA